MPSPSYCRACREENRAIKYFLALFWWTILAVATYFVLDVAWPGVCTPLLRGAVASLVGCVVVLCMKVVCMCQCRTCGEGQVR